MSENCLKHTIKIFQQCNNHIAVGQPLGAEGQKKHKKLKNKGGNKDQCYNNKNNNVRSQWFKSPFISHLGSPLTKKLQIFCQKLQTILLSVASFDHFDLRPNSVYVNPKVLFQLSLLLKGDTQWRDQKHLNQIQATQPPAHLHILWTHIKTIAFLSQVQTFQLS